MRKLIGFWLLSLLSLAAIAAPSAVFFYAAHPPVHQLQLFNTVVVDPHYVKAPEKYETSQSHWYAYVSLGEVADDSVDAKQVKSSWVLARNKTWRSEVMDATNPAWQYYFLHKIIAPLWREGYRHFFLDTVDSYHLAKLSKVQRSQQQQALVAIIKSIKQRYPGAKLILNRGFNIIPRVQSDIVGVAAESLNYSFDEKTKKTKVPSKADKSWLLGKLNAVKKMGLKVFVIDYLPNGSNKATADAKALAAQGFIPYISTPALNTLGTSTIIPEPRKIMMLWSSRESQDAMEAAPLTYLSMPLNYEGYVPRLYDVEKPLPRYSLYHRVAGIVVWLDGDAVNPATHLTAWLERAKANGIPIVFMGSLLYFQKYPQFMQRFGLIVGKNYSITKKVKVSQHSDLVGFEVKPKIYPVGFFPLTIKAAKIDLQLKDNKGNLEDAVATTSWGGVALRPYFAVVLPNKSSRYVVNPFKFLRKALRLPLIPAPDVTTENGRRILITHIDGDAFHSRSEWAGGPFSGETLLRTILDKYRIPVAVSIVEGEIGPHGLDPKNSAKLMAIARKIFALPWVEIASHSYSHPFIWDKAYKTEGKLVKVYGERLNLPNYRFSLRREIFGSAEFINKYLAPKGKRCKIFLWTGDTTPPAKAIELTYKAGLLNMNGGNTHIDQFDPSLTAVSGMGLVKNGWLQVFAPIQNENVYTNNWTGPYYGFIRVIETFKMTNKPRRLKPIDIYYHFYSASKASALNALDKVYDWSLKQTVIPLPASRYIKKVIDYYQLTMAKQLNGGWLVHGDGLVNEFRYPQQGSYPKISSSVVGFNALNHSWYIHTLAKPYLTLHFSDVKPQQPYLLNSNGVLTKRWRFQSYVPFLAEFNNAQHCQFSSVDKPMKVIKHDQVTTIRSSKNGKISLKISCQ